MQRSFVVPPGRLVPLGLVLCSLISACGGTGDSPASLPDTESRPIVAPADTDSPVVTITGPSGSGTYDSSVASVTITGSATDDVGVAKVVWSSNRGGSGAASGTASWSTGSIPLQSGANIITVTALDGSENSGTASITVNYGTPAAGDTTAPTVAIASPTGGSSYTTTAATVTLAGTSGDDVAVVRVTWSNNRGGSGAASGTSSWTAAGIPLQSGSNLITITAIDAADNASTDVLTVTYNPPDTTPPTVTINSPTTNPSYGTSTETISIAGVASDNVGVTRVTWSNSLGGSGTASGTGNWSATGIPLKSGSNVITVKAVDAANNAATDVLTVTYTPPTAGVTLAWDAPTTNADQTCLQDLSGYKVYAGNAPGSLSVVENAPVAGLVCAPTGQTTACGPVSNCALTLNGLARGTWYFAVTAYDFEGNESAFSNTASLTLN